MLLAMTQPAQAIPEKVKCDPNGTENDRIGCIDNSNVDLWESPNNYYAQYLELVVRKMREG